MLGWLWKGTLFALLLGRSDIQKVGWALSEIPIIVTVLLWQRERSSSSGYCKIGKLIELKDAHVFALLKNHIILFQFSCTHLPMTSREMLPLSLKMGESPSSSSGSSSSSTRVGLWTSFIKASSNSSLMDTLGSKRRSLVIFPSWGDSFSPPCCSAILPGWSLVHWSNHPSSLQNVPC